MRKRITATVLMLICVLGLFTGGGKIVASAETNAFSGDVGLLKQDGNNYVMQVTVENSGEDFSGTVQLIFGSGSYHNCAYNTELTLPAQGKKQFTVTVTQDAVDTVRGSCVLNFIDEKGNVQQSVSLQNVFGNTVTGIPVGILSDDYSALTYLDMGGRDYSARGMSSLPIELIELDSSNLDGYLDGLFFLVIDRFNVSSLSEAQIASIQEWVENGGWLLIGTGEYAEQTLSGFDEDFIGLEILNIYEPGEENFMSVNAHNGYYYYFEDAGIDYTKMAIAELDIVGRGSYYEDGSSPAYRRSVGDGSMAVFFCSLGDEELKKLSDYGVESMYDNLMYDSNSYRYYVNGSSNINYVGQRTLAYIDNRNTNVDFTWLEVLIAIYVLLVGPILYLILRKGKRSEWYWVSAPVLGIAFIGCVYLFGQGARVNNTKVYSVTVQRTDSNREDTYFLAYHSGVDEWNMRLNDSYDVAGPGFTGYYYYSSSSNVNSATDYYYTVTNGSDGLSVGIKPNENFESGFLYAGGKAESKGALTAEGLKLPTGNISGTVTNDTGYDLAYMAVWLNDHNYLAVYSDVAAGETLDLMQAANEGRCVYQEHVNYLDDLLYSMVGLYYNHTDYEQDDMAALLIGLGVASNGELSGSSYITYGYGSSAVSASSIATPVSTVTSSQKAQAILIGVVRDYEKTVADKCSEISYGCLYSYVEAETEVD